VGTAAWAAYPETVAFTATVLPVVGPGPTDAFLAATPLAKPVARFPKARTLAAFGRLANAETFLERRAEQQCRMLLERGYISL
jgi:hypothetical protein